MAPSGQRSVLRRAPRLPAPTGASNDPGSSNGVPRRPGTGPPPRTLREGPVSRRLGAIGKPIGPPPLGPLTGIDSAPIDGVEPDVRLPKPDPERGPPAAGGIDDRTGPPRAPRPGTDSGTSRPGIAGAPPETLRAPRPGTDSRSPRPCTAGPGAGARRRPWPVLGSREVSGSARRSPPRVRRPTPERSGCLTGPVAPAGGPRPSSRGSRPRLGIPAAGCAAGGRRPGGPPAGLRVGPPSRGAPAAICRTPEGDRRGAGAGAGVEAPPRPRGGAGSPVRSLKSPGSSESSAARAPRLRPRPGVPPLSRPQKSS